jgi:dTDP-4-dehydrorhamnose reductase
MRLLVTGAAGMLGRDVVAAANNAGHDVVAVSRADLDITDAAAARAAVLDARPDAVDGAGAGNVAAAAAATGALLVHVSSDYVFDGDAAEPYTEDAPTGPRSAYGRSKLAGEHAIAAAAGRSAIVRSSWLFGPHGRNFVDAMRRVGAERDEVAVVDDQIGCPTYTGHLARALVAVAEHELTGVLHVAGAGRCSWFDLAVATFAETGIECRVRPQATADLGRPAPRPAFSALASTRADAPVLPDWREGLRAHLARVEVTTT